MSNNNEFIKVLDIITRINCKLLIYVLMEEILVASVLIKQRVKRVIYMMNKIWHVGLLYI